MKHLFLLFTTLVFLSSCNNEEIKASSDNRIITLTVEGVDEYRVSINEKTSRIALELKEGTPLNALTLTFTLAEGAKMTSSGSSLFNLTTPQNITITAQNGLSRMYRISANHVVVDNLITSVSIPLLSFEGSRYIDGNHIKFIVPYGTNLSAITLFATLTTGTTAFPAFGTPTDYTAPVQYKLTDKNGFSRIYTVSFSIADQIDEIRGVWLADPRFTSVLKSYKGVQDFINLLDNLNMNTIYVSVWSLEKTLFKSQVLKANSNYTTVEEGWMLKGINYSSSTNDPLRDLITLAHAKAMKVIFWYEYGFMRSGNASTNFSSHAILSVHPQWDGKGWDVKNNTTIPSNYNNTDFYLNSYDAEVQEFMIKLIEESIDLYPTVDGIQGDDRMPAAPRNSGYNTVTLAQYHNETGNSITPLPTMNDPQWVQWRLNNLNAFAKTLHRRIRAKRSDLLVCFSPNPYPWCEDALMQDWPQWIRDGVVDILSVQCYRSDIDTYRQTIVQCLSYITPNTGKKIFNPGIYLRTNDVNWDIFFSAQMNVNREYKTCGETFFYNEGLKSPINQQVIKRFYPNKSNFPNLFK